MEEEKSKSQQKREMHDLQKFAVKLAELSAQQLAMIPSTENFLKALSEYKKITSHGAKRRQAQLLGKLMRNEDYEAMSCAYDKIQNARRLHVAKQHEIENWRERLLSEGKVALTEFMNSFENIDSQELRNLVAKARKEKEQDKNLGGQKALYRYLATVIIKEL